MFSTRETAEQYFKSVGSQIGHNDLAVSDTLQQVFAVLQANPAYRAKDVLEAILNN
jgi:hypothetical protein